MAVDSQRNIFHFNTITADEIGLIMTAQSYRPDITTAVRQIKEFREYQVLQSLCSQPIRQGKSPIYADYGHPCLKTRHIVNILASKENLDYVTKDSAQKGKQYAVDNGNILMNRSGAGSIGRVSIYFGNDKPLTDDHLFKIVIASPNDPAYVCCFLASWWGERAIEQGISGTTGQLNLSSEHVQQLPVPLPDRAVQNYIGDKVRLAEKLRERSKQLENHARLIYEQNLKLLGYVEMSSRKSYSASLKDRLDPAYYSPEFTSIFDSDWFLNNSQPLGNFIAEGSYGFLPDSKLYGNGTERLLTASDIAICNYNSQAGVAIPKKVVNKKGLIKLNDILLEIKGAIEQCEIASCLAEGKYVNGSVFRFSVKNIPLGYLAFNLTGFIKQKYCKREAVNNMIQYLNIDTIRNLPVIRLDNKIEEDISNKYIYAKNFSIISSALTTAAKYLVEALIEGKLTETELKNTQTALQEEDIEPDKAILAKLTRQGYDIPDQPALFPDLDALYEAIKEINLTSDS